MLTERVQVLQCFCADLACVLVIDMNIVITSDPGHQLGKLSDGDAYDKVLGAPAVPPETTPGQRSQLLRCRVAVDAPCSTDKHLLISTPDTV